MPKMDVVCEFALGQRVWVMSPQSVKKTETKKCGFCGGSGKIQGKDKRKMLCPECRGSGKISNHSYHHKPVSGTIEVIQVTKTCSMDGDEVMKAEISYRISNPKVFGCTGYRRSGPPFFSESRVFATKKECQEQIDHGLA